MYVAAACCLPYQSKKYFYMSFDALQVTEGPELKARHDVEIGGMEGLQPEQLPQVGEEQQEDFLGGMDAGFDQADLAEPEDYMVGRPSLHHEGGPGEARRQADEDQSAIPRKPERLEPVSKKRTYVAETELEEYRKMKRRLVSFGPFDEEASTRTSRPVEESAIEVEMLQKHLDVLGDTDQIEETIVPKLREIVKRSDGEYVGYHLWDQYDPETRRKQAS